jgi:hypothetical protein
MKNEDVEIRCCGWADRMHRAHRALGDLGVGTDNLSTDIRLAALDELARVRDEIRDYARLAATTAGYDDGGEVFPPSDVQVPRVKTTPVKQNGAKRGRKPKPAAPPLPDGALPGQEPLIVAGVPVPVGGPPFPKEIEEEREPSFHGTGGVD